MKCHNDEKKYYKGDEPSPKGRGYCASAERVGKRMKGKDGKIWEVVKVKNGKRWMKVKSLRASSPSRKKMSPSRKGKKKTSPRMDGDLDRGDLEVYLGPNAMDYYLDPNAMDGDFDPNAMDYYLDPDAMENAFLEPEGMESTRKSIIRALEEDYGVRLNDKQRDGFLVFGQNDILLLISYLNGDFTEASEKMLNSPFANWSIDDLRLFTDKLKKGMMPYDAANEIKEEKKKIVYMDL